MTARTLFLIALAVGAFGVCCVVLVDSIRYRYKRWNGTRELRRIGLEVDEDERAWTRNRR